MREFRSLFRVIVRVSGSQLVFFQNSNIFDWTTKQIISERIQIIFLLI